MENGKIKARYAAAIPVFNPERGLLPLARGLTEKFDTVIVIDDGSVESTEAFSALMPNVVLLRHPANRGKGRAMKTALEWLLTHRPDVRGVVFADGDGQHRLDDIAKVAEHSSKTNDVVFGVRDFSMANVPFRSWWGNLWTAAEVRLLHGFRLTDTQTGLRAVPFRLFAELANLTGERFEYEAAWFLRLRQLKEPIHEVPIETIYIESNRSSHFRALRDTLLTQLAIIRRSVGKF